MADEQKHDPVADPPPSEAAEMPAGTAPRWRRHVVTAGALIVGLAIGALLFAGPEAPPAHQHAGDDGTVTAWTCSMHPQVRLPEAGQCPICFMDLIPVTDDANDASSELVLSEGAKALAEVRTAEVRRGAAEREVALVGRVTYDETLVQRVASFVPGRIEKLYVEVTGTRVKRGEHLLRIYSPELLAAQTEWLDALSQVGRMPAGSAARGVLQKTAEGAAERLRLWGLSKGQLDRIRAGGKPQERITVFSPRGGVVVERNAIVGMYVKEGTPLYTVAELDRLWVELDAYERDLPHVRFGQTVDLQTDARPGQHWKGRVAFVSPIVDERTRTVRVRVTFDNEDGALKPGMMVRALLRAQVDEHGHAISEEGIGELYVCPMHPDVVKDRPGRCDVCGMSLEPAKDLGLIQAAGGKAPLLIPASAPLLTGKRAVVYVEVPNRDKPTYEGRSVVLGPRVGDRYVVKSGLVEGERVVVQGAFKLDAAMQVKARPSMMSPPTAPSETGQPTPAPPEGAVPFRPGSSPTAPRKDKTSAAPAPAWDRAAWAAMVDAYVVVETALTGDDFAAAKKAAGPLLRTARALAQPPLEKAAAALGQAEDIKAMRRAFVPVSAALIAQSAEHGAGSKPAHKFFCPMADGGKGAEWLQRTPELSNPYFGSAMLKCGESRGTVEASR